MAEGQLERERKYDVPPDFVMPAFPGAEHRTHHLHAEYYDTEEALLQAAGVTLRRRLGGDDEGWHLKIPHRDGKIELHWDVASDDPPGELEALTRGVRFDRPLRRRAILDTVRKTSSIATQAGELVAEIADDTVTATVDSTGDAVRWREVEVELGPAGTAESMERFADQLEDAGATESEVASKLARAVGEPEEPCRPGLAGLVDAYLREQHDRLARGDLRMRRDKNAVHKTRVAVRRLRSTLRIFGSLFDEARREDLDAELSWYADALGRVRDLDVAWGHFEDDVVADEDEDELVSPDAARGLLELVASEREEAWQDLRTLMDEQRYGRLLHALGTWRNGAPFTTDAGTDADEVAAFVRRARKKSDKRLRQAASADGDDADEALHRARKAAKRTRYAAELARPELGKKAKKIAKAYEERQDGLGELQDHRMAVSLLRELASCETASPEVALLCGVLAERHSRALDEARGQWI